jgi:hypothetical protein
MQYLMYKTMRDYDMNSVLITRPHVFLLSSHLISSLNLIVILGSALKVYMHGQKIYATATK